VRLGDGSGQGPEPEDRLVLFEQKPLAALAALGALGAAAFCFVTTENLPVGLLDVISADLHASVPSIGLLVTAYAVVVALTSAPLTHLTRGAPRRLLLCGLVATFVVATLVSAEAADYWWLLGARVVTALAQAVFWSVAAVTAVSLFGPAVRAKAVAGVLGGGSVAVVLGVPAGTWLGEQGGWRLPFLVLSGIGLVILVAIGLLLPAYHPAQTHAAVGSQPDRYRYRLLMLSTALIVGGYFTTYTYVSNFLVRVAHLAPHDVAAVLLLAGLGSAIGVGAAGAFFDRLPRLAAVVPLALVTASLVGLFVFGTSRLGAEVLVSTASLGLGSFVIANQNRVLLFAPASTDVASAWASSAFNVGIAGGSFAGGLVLNAAGVRLTALVGAAMAVLALVVVVFDSTRSTRTRVPATPCQASSSRARLLSGHDHELPHGFPPAPPPRSGPRPSACPSAGP